VLSKYVESGVDELDQEKLPQLLINKYQSMPDALKILGNAKDVGLLFMEFQKYLYEERVA
jgi:type I restriction enzyme, R subunit